MKLILFISLMLAGGCTKLTDEKDLPGIYKSTPSFCVSTLIINPDHSFQQEIQFNDNRPVQKISGNWTFSDSRILLQDSIPITNGYGKPPGSDKKTPASWDVVKNVLSKKVRFDNDEYFPYKRMN